MNICNSDSCSLPLFSSALLAHWHTCCALQGGNTASLIGHQTYRGISDFYLFAIVFPLPVINALFSFVYQSKVYVTFTTKFEGHYFQKFSVDSSRAFLCFTSDVLLHLSSTSMHVYFCIYYIVPNFYESLEMRNVASSSLCPLQSIPYSFVDCKLV